MAKKIVQEEVGYEDLLGDGMVEVAVPAKKVTKKSTKKVVSAEGNMVGELMKEAKKTSKKKVIEVQVPAENENVDVEVVLTTGESTGEAIKTMQESVSEKAVQESNEEIAKLDKLVAEKSTPTRNITFKEIALGYYKQGKTISEIAKIMGKRYQQIRQYIVQYEEKEQEKIWDAESNSGK